MAESYQIQVKTIYRAAGDRAATSELRLRVLGSLTLTIGVVWLYVAWNPIKAWIEPKVMIGEAVMATGNMPAAQTGEGAQSLQALGQILNQAAKTPQPTSGKRERPKSTPAPKPTPPPSPPPSARRVQGSLAGLALSWLGAATFVALWLVMAGVAGLSGGWSGVRRGGAVLLPLSLIALAALVWYVQRKYEWYETILPVWVRPGLFGLAILLAGSIGALASRYGWGAQRIGGYLVIGSAVFSAAVIWSAVRWGQMPAGHVDAALYAKVFGVQSAYGWLLLLGTMRRGT